MGANAAPARFGLSSFVPSSPQVDVKQSGGGTAVQRQHGEGAELSGMEDGVKEVEVQG